MKHQMIYPMAVYVFSIWLLALCVFRSRVRGIRSGETSAKYFKTYTGAPPPDSILILGQHYDNQFQVPMLFLITGVLFVALDAVNPLAVGLAWLFVFSRAFHSWVHLGSNKLIPRVAGFAFGWMAVVLLWVQLFAFAVGASRI